MVVLLKEELVRMLMEKIETNPQCFLFAAISHPKNGSSDIKRVRIRPLMMKGGLFYQVTSYTRTQSFSINIKPSELFSQLLQLLERFIQLVVRFTAEEIHVHIKDSGCSYKVTKHKKIFLQSLEHNRPKNYHISENEPSDVLIGCGLQSQSGKILPGKYDKFKQINRFLEIVEDLRPLIGERPKIVDFGCGKAYLTFALTKSFPDAEITGIDARHDVIDKATRLRDTLGLKNLRFVQSSIEEYPLTGPIDLVLALHACDTATDAAIAKAIQLKAKTALFAPCCQHFLASQIKKERLPLLLQHGLLRTRFSALLTDALRAEILSQHGYSVDLIEFIDPEHTPKNLLIRAKLKQHPPAPDWTAYRELARSFGISPTLATKCLVF